MADHNFNNQKFSFTNSFVKGEIFLGSGFFLKKGISAVASFFVLTSFSLYQVGAYHLLLSVYDIVSSFVHDLFGQVVGNDLARFIGMGREDKAKRLFGEYVIFRIAIVAIPAGLVLWLAPFLFLRYGNELVVWVRILALLLLSEVFLRLAIVLLNIRLQFKILAYRPAWQDTIRLLMILYFYFFSTLGIKELLLAQAATPILTLLILMPAVIKSYRCWQGVKAYQDNLLFPIIRSYGKWEIPRFFTSDLSNRIRPWLIKAFLSVEAVGIFGVANTFISLINDVFPTRTLSSLVPRKIHDKNYFTRIFLYGTKYYVLLGLVLVSGGAIAVPWAVNLFFAKFAVSIPLFYLLLPTILIFAFSKIMNVLLVAQRRQKFIFYQSILRNGFELLFLVLFLPFFAIYGLALAGVLAMLISTTIQYYYLVKTKFINKFSIRQLFFFGAQDRVILSALWKNFSGFFARKGIKS